MPRGLAGSGRAIAAALLIAAALAAQPAAAAEIEVETTNDELDGDAECSLREAVQAANDNLTVSGCGAGDAGEDTIVVPAEPFSEPFEYELDGDDNEDANAGGDLDISESVVIDGDPFTVFGDVVKPVISGDDQDRAFDIVNGASPVSVTLDELELSDGRARDQNGGAIRSDETDATLTLTETDITFSRTNRDGGGIHSRGELSTDRGSFAENTATGDGGAIESHGPLSLNGDTALGSAPEFTENAALGNGGAVSAYGPTESLHTSFADNRAERGGAIANDTDPLTIDGGAITGNEADGAGGAIESDGDVSITEALLEANLGLTGGAVFTDVDASTSVTDSQLSGNRAALGVGGAVDTGSIAATGTDFDRNRAISGGAVFAREGGTVTGSDLTENTATGIVQGDSGSPGLGGALFGAGDSLLIDSSTVEGNTAGLEIRQGSGAIFQEGGELILRASTVTRNTAVEAVVTASEGSLTMENSTVADNRMTAGRAAVFVTSDFVLPSTVSHSTVSGNVTRNRSTGSSGQVTGGVAFDGPNTIQRSILAFNSVRLRSGVAASNCSSPDLITSGGNNLESHDTCGFIPDSPYSEVTGTNPLLGPLADNGGLTDTMGLYDSSPAIDATPGCPPPAVDQRDILRPAGPQCDIGAFEGSLGAPTHECRGVAATVIGTRAADVIVGTSGPDVIAGLEGNDTILGARGNDRICGNQGRDKLKGGSGRNRVFQ